jgi:hypothetical protein
MGLLPRFVDADQGHRHDRLIAQDSGAPRGVAPSATYSAIGVPEKLGNHKQMGRR